MRADRYLPRRERTIFSTRPPTNGAASRLFRATPPRCRAAPRVARSVGPRPYSVFQPPRPIVALLPCPEVVGVTPQTTRKPGSRSTCELLSASVVPRRRTRPTRGLRHWLPTELVDHGMARELQAAGSPTTSFRGVRGRSHEEPCGVRRAVATVFAVPASGRATAPAALCGATISGWRIIPDVAFDPTQAAACQRCAQLVSCLALPRIPSRPPVAPRSG